MRRSASGTGYFCGGSCILAVQTTKVCRTFYCRSRVNSGHRSQYRDVMAEAVLEGTRLDSAGVFC